MSTHRKENSELGDDGVPMQHFNCVIPVQIVKRVRVESIIGEVSTSSIVADALEFYFARDEKKETVTKQGSKTKKRH